MQKTKICLGFPALFHILCNKLICFHKLWDLFLSLLGSDMIFVLLGGPLRYGMVKLGDKPFPVETPPPLAAPQ